MYLKALEMQGFKSFPEKTRLTFEKDVTAIVGPNGSGKSNISDAILWVMGEQRTRALRGGKMEDVVFGGTQTRPKMGFAQVSLVLDNSERFFDTDSTELMITRRFYRSGESEYYINRESVRLKDITELLMDTGLGRYGYSIIGQGKITEIISAKSGDRRELFEEAAGISRYRHRKDEAERKLLHTDENLVRINDKIDELKIQVDPLREQAETAKKYLVLRDELRLIEISVWMETLDKLAERAGTVKADWEKSKSDAEKSKLELAELYAAGEIYAEKMREKDIEAECEREKLSEAEGAAARLEGELAVLRNTGAHNLERQAQLRSEINEQSARSKGLETQIEGRRGRVADIEAELLDLSEQVHTLTVQAQESAEGDDGVRRDLSALLLAKSELQTKLSQTETVISMLKDAHAEQTEARERHAGEMAGAVSKRAELETELRVCEASLKEAEDKSAELSNVITGYKMRVDGREKKAADLREKMTALTIDLNSTASRLHMLTEMEKEYEGYSRAVKTVMRSAGRGELGGVHGPVANLVKADDRYALAIETALGASMQSIIIDTQEQGARAIELLKRRDEGRATFLPLSTIRPSELRQSPQNEEGYLGTAFELSSFDDKYRNIFSNLLARTVVAETLSDAVKMSKKFDNQLRIVTLDGQLINPGGSMTGGSASKGTGILSRANELSKLEAKKRDLEREAESVSAGLKEAEREFNTAKYELQTAEIELGKAQETGHKRRSELSNAQLLLSQAERDISELELREQNAGLRQKDNEERAGAAQSDLTRFQEELTALEAKLDALSQTREENDQKSRELSEKLSAIAEQRSSLSSERDATQAAIAQLEELFGDLLSDDEARRGTIESLEAERRELLSHEAAASEKIESAKTLCDDLRAGLQAIINGKLELEGKRNRNEKLTQEKNNELLSLERTNSAIEQKMLSSEMEEKQVIDKLWDSYELSRTAASAIRQPLESMSAATKRISGLKRDISALGTPNLGAIDEYDRVSGRYEFLTQQRDDVETAKNELLAIIFDITAEMEQIFRREFDLVDESFRKTFTELFGGGRAALVLDDENDILNCGIEINVQPPGKALTTLSLLSGGETAFVAIALYFAILKVRPSPFCVMDEIEAALDEANVERYAEYMRTMTEMMQFIVITHRRRTMEEADVLYGVTMQEKGISQVITVDLEEAERHLAKPNAIKS